MVRPEYNFSISSDGIISRCFLERGINDFNSAALFIRDLPYGRNPDKNDLATIFSDMRGTCSTKHAVLKQLAIENGAQGVQLILCIFKMNGKDSPAVRHILEQHGLEYIPEAHNFLRINGKMLDITQKNWDTDGIARNIVTEATIQPGQISDHKVKWHQAFLKEWLAGQPQIYYSLEELWEIRESCIKALC